MSLGKVSPFVALALDWYRVTTHSDHNGLHCLTLPNYTTQLAGPDKGESNQTTRYRLLSGVVMFS